tara:strand:+ start:495 stop:1556 length:1062 start_codon:yes stop_codon:yes gene_type:complete
MKLLTSKLLYPTTAIVLLLLCVAWMAGMFTSKVQPSLNRHKTKISSQAITAQVSTIDLTEAFSGSVKAKQTTIMSSRILSVIEQLTVRAGDVVQQGQLLVKLEQADLQAQVRQSQEHINGVSARKTEAQQNLKRAIDLNQQGLIAKFGLDKANADYDALSADLNAAKQALVAANTILSYSNIISPIQGRVVERFAEPGDTVQPGQQLLSIYNPSSLRLEAQVREGLAISLSQGQEIKIALPTLKRIVAGVIEEIVPAANIGSRSFLVKASIEYNNDLLPGMYAKFLIPAGQQQALLIPNDRVGQVGQLSIVWVEDKGLAQRRFVRLGKTNHQGMVPVISGISVGEKILPIPPL